MDELEWFIPDKVGLPQLNPNCAGKVFIEKQENIEIVEDAKLSNIDLNIYNSDGDLHPLNNDFKGRKWSVRFGINEVDRFGGKHKIVVELLSPLLLGEMGKIDWKGIPESMEFEQNLGFDCGVFKNNDKERFRFSLSAFAAYTSPGIFLKDAKPYIAAIILQSYLENLLSNRNILKKALTFEEMGILREKLIEILRGDKLPEEQLLSFDFPDFGYICLWTKNLREAVLKLDAPVEFRDRFFNDMDEYLDASTTQCCAEWTGFHKTGFQRRAYSPLREADIGAPVCFSIIALVFGNTLKDEIYNSRLFQYYKSLASEYSYLLNDLLSYKKEAEDDEAFNFVIIRHKVEGMSLSEVIQLCIARLNEIANDMMGLGEKLMELHNNDEQLKEQIYLLKAYMLGELFWYKFVPRYRQNLIFDAVIHCEDEINNGN